MSDNFSIKESISEFINYKLVDGYDYNLGVFCQFIETKGVTIDTVKPVFQGARSEFLIESLNYYIDSRKVTSIGASGRYASCIKEYFIHIVQKGYIKNDELMAEFTYKTYDEKSYRYKVNHYLSEKTEIVQSAGFEMFEQAKELINDCDDIMNDEYILSKIYSSQMYFNKYRSALMIKLILLTGITYRTIIKIKIQDLDLQHCSIAINDLTIHLPNNLIDQIDQYVRIRSKILEKEKINNNVLFIESDGKAISSTTSTLAGFLKDLTGRGDLNGIIKYAITNLIRKGINQSIIVKFTGVGSTIYKWCQDEVNKTMDLHSSKYLDSKIRSLDIFDLL